MGRVRSGYKKSDWYDGLEVDPSARTIVLETNDVRHDKLRAMMAAGVCFPSLYSSFYALSSTGFLLSCVVRGKRKPRPRNPSRPPH
jgi:hypothetical protein